MNIRWLSPLFSLPKSAQQLCVMAAGERYLLEMGEDLAGTADLAAIYVPLDAEAPYTPGAQRGKVAGLVRLLDMPDGRSARDYTQADILDPSYLRWPFGWPIELVLRPAPEECPTLRNILVSAYYRDRLKEMGENGLLSRPYRVDRALGAAMENAFKQSLPEQWLQQRPSP